MNIIRLRHNVIKTGIKMISLSYAKISFSDVAQKLQVDSPEDAEYIVAKVSFPMNLQKKSFIDSKETKTIPRDVPSGY